MKKININETELRSLVRESIYNVLGNDKEEINDKLQMAYRCLHDLYHMELDKRVNDNVKIALEAVRKSIAFNGR